MEREEYMARNEWLIQYLFILMVLLAVGLVIGMVVSFDFIVPVGTPPNAMAYGTGYAKVIDMVKAGLLLSILGSLAIALMAFMW